MEITLSRKSELSPDGPSHQPWAVEIRSRFGSLPEFTKRFAPACQKFCALNMAAAIERNVPSFARVIAAYGSSAVASLINTHITDAILRMGEDRDADAADIRSIAEAITESQRFRPLRFTTILGFFHLLKCGEFDIYGRVTPRKILEVARRYAIDAAAKEHRLAEQFRHLRDEAQRLSYDANTVSWSEYARAAGIDAPSLDTYLATLLSPPP